MISTDLRNTRVRLGRLQSKPASSNATYNIHFAEMGRFRSKKIAGPISPHLPTCLAAIIIKSQVYLEKHHYKAIKHTHFPRTIVSHALALITYVPGNFEIPGKLTRGFVFLKEISRTTPELVMLPNFYCLFFIHFSFAKS